MKAYPKMKDSGMRWIEKIPQSWDVKRLKFTTKFDLSTVDRHEYDNEIQVSISHYPQVYNNEKITTQTELPKGTCNQKELEKFRLKKDDVLITKDSETQDDIGVPVYIQDNFKNAVCGYHIAQLSSDKNQILGSFLFRFIQSDIANAYFETEANGITRFGLGKDSIGNLKTILPSILEQKLISVFIEKEISIITNQTSNNQKLIKFLEERRRVIINYAVTKGLDPTVAMKDSGVDEVGKIPEHWIMRKVKNSELFSISSGEFVDFQDSGAYPVFGSNGLIGRYDDFNSENVIIIGRVGQYAGSITPVFTKAWVTDNGLIVKPKSKIRPKFLYYTFINLDFNRHAQKTAQPLITQNILSLFQFALPPKSEQKQISQFLDKQTSKIDSLISNTELQTEKLKEYRQAIISSTVTGKIDVREVIT